MDFKDVKLLTYEHKNNFWGDRGFRYSSTVSMSIKGYVLNLSNTYGVTGVLATCKALSDSLNSYQDIIINNINYGRGKINAVSFDSSNWVKVTEYTASIEIIKEGDLQSLTGDEFNNNIIASIKTGVQYLEEFSESYSADYSSNEDSISGGHSIDVRVSTLFVGDKIDFAKNLASVLFSKTFVENLSEITYSKPSELLRKDFYSENYDTITGACGFRRNFSYSNTTDCYSKKRSIVVSFGEDGITNVTESNSIKGECLNYTLFDSAETGFASEISGVFLRCDAALTTYKTQFGVVASLINKEVQRSVKRNKFTGEIEYSVTFTNDKRRKNLYTYEYTLDLSRSEDFIWNAIESGSVKGDGVIGSSDKFDQALAGWNAENISITARVTSFYTSNALIKPSSPVLKHIAKNTTHHPFDGVVSYSWSYTDDPTLDMTSDIRRKSIEINDSKATLIHNDFLIPGGAAKYSIAQSASQSKQSERDIKGNLEITSSTVPFVGNAYFADALSIAVANKGTGTDLYLESFSFSSDEIEQNVEFAAKYKYSQAASAT